MKDNYTRQFKTTLWLPVPLAQAWEFFSSPFNLAQITPPGMEFRVLSKNLESKIYNGMLIDYSVAPLLGIKMKWKTRIMNVSEQQYFTDVQLKGPYKMWEHTHYFEEKDGGVLMTDIVNYQLHFGVLGLLMNRLLIRSKIAAIFDFRRERLIAIFGGEPVVDRGVSETEKKS